MQTLANQFLALSPEQRKAAQVLLAEHALTKWIAHVSSKGHMQYREMVAGTTQVVDKSLPEDALESVRIGRDSGNVRERYKEPITAIRDEDFQLPDPIEFAYYAIYNLFEKYVAQKPVDDWVIVNQAISSEENEAMWEVLLANAIRKAI